MKTHKASVSSLAENFHNNAGIDTKKIKSLSKTIETIKNKKLMRY